MKLLQILSESNLISNLQYKHLMSKCDSLKNDEEVANALIKYLGLNEKIVVDALNKAQQEVEYVCITNNRLGYDPNLDTKLAINKALLLSVDDTGYTVACTRALRSMEKNNIAKTIGTTLPINYNTVIPYCLQKTLKGLLSEDDINKVLLSEVFTDNQKEIENILDILLIDGIDLKCTDIHLAPKYNTTTNILETSVVFRDNPDLYKWDKMPISIPQLASIKNMICTRAGSNSSDANRSEGIIFTHSLGFSEYTFRISIMSFEIDSSSYQSNNNEIVDGYSITIRIQEKNKNALPIESLHLGQLSMKDIKHSTTIESGLVCVSGAMGAGKNTTYASIINDVIATKERVIWELGSPIEYKMPIVQIPVKNTEDVRYKVINAKTQDLDEIIITELRDPAISGYIKDMLMSRVKVTLTLHTSRIWGVVDKFFEYCGADNYLFMLRNSTLLIQQCMFKELCPKCKVPLPVEEMTPRERRVYENLRLQGHVVYTKGDPSNCKVDCKTGYTSRRLPCAESILFDKTDPECNVLINKIQSLNETSTLTKVIKSFILDTGRALEYIARDRLITGQLDFRKVVDQDIINEITEKGIENYERLRNS